MSSGKSPLLTYALIYHHKKDICYFAKLSNKFITTPLPTLFQQKNTLNKTNHSRKISKFAPKNK